MLAILLALALRPEPARPEPVITTSPWPAPPAPPPMLRSGGPTAARARAPLAAYLSEDDYPAEAIRRGEEGTVAFRLDIGRDGRVTGCTVTESSGSAVLDSTTCRLMTTRPRFTPARDQYDQPVEDRVSAKIRWLLPVEPIPRLVSFEATATPGKAASERFSDCEVVEIVGGEQFERKDALCGELAWSNPFVSVPVIRGSGPVRMRYSLESLLDGEPEAALKPGERVVGRTVHRLQLDATGRVTECVREEARGLPPPDDLCARARQFDIGRFNGVFAPVVVQQLLVAGAATGEGSEDKVPAPSR